MPESASGSKSHLVKEIPSSSGSLERFEKSDRQLFPQGDVRPGAQGTGYVNEGANFRTTPPEIGRKTENLSFISCA